MLQIYRERRVKCPGYLISYFRAKWLQFWCLEFYDIVLLIILYLPKHDGEYIQFQKDTFLPDATTVPILCCNPYSSTFCGFIDINVYKDCWVVWLIDAFQILTHVLAYSWCTVSCSYLNSIFWEVFNRNTYFCEELITITIIKTNITLKNFLLLLYFLPSNSCFIWLKFQVLQSVSCQYTFASSRILF